MTEKDKIIVEFAHSIDEELLILKDNYRSKGKLLYMAIVEVCREIIKTKLKEVVKSEEWKWIKT